MIVAVPMQTLQRCIIMWSVVKLAIACNAAATLSINTSNVRKLERTSLPPR